MSTIKDIEAAVDALSAEEKERLFLFIAARLRMSGERPQPREFTPEQIREWIADDEEGLRRLNPGT